MKGVAARIGRAKAFIEGEDHCMLTAVCCCHGVGQSDRGFTYTCASNEKGTRAAVKTTAKKSIKLLVTTRRRLAKELFVVL